MRVRPSAASSFLPLSAGGEGPGVKFPAGVRSTYLHPLPMGEGRGEGEVACEQCRWIQERDLSGPASAPR